MNLLRGNTGGLILLTGRTRGRRGSMLHVLFALLVSAFWVETTLRQTCRPQIVTRQCAVWCASLSLIHGAPKASCTDLRTGARASRVAKTPRHSRRHKDRDVSLNRCSPHGRTLADQDPESSHCSWISRQRERLQHCNMKGRRGLIEYNSTFSVAEQV